MWTSCGDGDVFDVKVLQGSAMVSLFQLHKGVASGPQALKNRSTSWSTIFHNHFMHEVIIWNYLGMTVTVFRDLPIDSHYDCKSLFY